MTKILDAINGFVWGIPALVLILGVGMFLSLRTGFPQITLFPDAFRRFFRTLKGNDQSSFRALCTALAATVGTGNLVGVAGAICIGGPGSIFWMWICGILGMATKFAEATLAVRYRVKTEDGYAGGPMYMITQGMGRRWHKLAKLYCLLGVFAAFGVGNAAQINAVVTGMNGLLNRDARLFLGIVLAVLVGRMLLGGAKRIGQAAEMLVPFVSVSYILLCGGVLIARFGEIPGAFSSIVQGAFSPKAITGGMIGGTMQALRVGCSRGVFTNEAGMGTASIAHGTADVSHPVCQGLMGIMEVFLDTIVICTLTALVILCSGVPIPYGTDVGGTLTTEAFEAVYGGWVEVFLTAALCCFAFATVLGWGLYGGRCAQFLLGRSGWTVFAVAQTGMVLVGALLKTEQVWMLSELLNGLMAIPNLIALAVLSPELRRLTIDYKKSGRKAGGGTYADFHQRKPL